MTFEDNTRRLLIWALAIVSIGIDEPRLGPHERGVNNFREGSLIVYQC